MLSPVDTAIIFGVALLVFGPKKLPELGKALGQGLGNFKKHLQDAQNEVKSAMNTEAEGSSQGASLKPPSATPAAAGPVAAETDPKASSG
jgi:sec-independent protein translocase protein TatA